MRQHRFVGVSLGGGKTNRTCLADIEYYPDQGKIFLCDLIEKIKSAEETSADSQLHTYIESLGKNLESVAFDVPLQMPKCMRCRLKCPGYEKCNEPEIKWLRKSYQKYYLQKKPKKLFTPYTERCVESYLANELEEVFQLPHALGANAAPLTARALYITRRLKVSCIEVFPKLSLWRIGRTLGIQKSYLRFHKHAVSGEEIRQAILNKLIQENIAFIYDEDVKTMVANPQAFDAFLCAYTAVLKFKGKVEKRPRGFPKNESWLAIPL